MIKLAFATIAVLLHSVAVAVVANDQLMTDFVVARSVVPGCDNCGKSWDSTTLGRARDCSGAATTDIALARNERSRTVWLRSFPWPTDIGNASRLVDVHLRIFVCATGAMNFTNCNLHLSATSVRPFPCNGTVLAGGLGRDYTLEARAAVGSDLQVRHIRGALFGISFGFVSVFDARVVQIRCGQARALLSNATAPPTSPFNQTATMMASTTTTDPRCARLPRGEIALPAPISCVADLDDWRIDCPSTVSLPSKQDAFAEFGDLTLRINRCPKPAFELSFDYEIKIDSSVIKAALQSRGITIPPGSQRATFSKTLETITLEIPVWPTTGIVDIPATSITAASRVGLALVIKDVKLEAARASLTIAVRVCSGRPTCTDIAIGTVAYGNNDACCLPANLQCADEAALCSPTTSAAVGATSARFLTDQLGSTVTDLNGMPVTVPSPPAVANSSPTLMRALLLVVLVLEYHLQ